ncbi:GTF2F2 [Bugula neritina]|uniref:General transcription factor IIF subunit 2 n=1 Tax=Bugula neritina TaxID=10212 RepID=A0A7J7KIP3_BUGNE|nr:GTF2F2 [Bugula neritina]
MADNKDGILDPHIPRVVESQLASKGVWLVKVPKYLAEKMKSASGEIGKIKTTMGSAGKPEVLFCLNENLKSSGDETTPTTHRFIMSAGFSQNLTVLTETDNGGLALEGKVIQRMECRPHGDQHYMKYKKHQVEESNKPKRYVMQIDKPVNTYKPVSNHAHLAEHEAKKKADGKRSRDDAEKVKEVLFKAFERHQYYTLRDLHNLTKQPVAHLKEVLHSICVYNKKAPHKNMYELKPEYRHYGAE